MVKTIVSVVMATYNDMNYLTTSIGSVINQAFKNWELIIIDDASTDKTPMIINSYKKNDSRIKSHRFSTNQGPPVCLNYGISLSKGKYIARIDSDDVWIDSHKLQKQVSLMEKNISLSFIGTWAKVIDIHGREVYKLMYPTKYNALKNQMLRHNNFISSTVLMRKVLLEKAGGYGTTQRYAQDYGLWLKLGTLGRFENIPEFMTAYRINPSGISQSKYKLQTDAAINLVRQYKSYYPHYYSSSFLWNIRKYYPSWFRGKLSKQIKDLFK